MQWEERGIATAMSLGGKARDIAQDIPQAVLGRRDGLSVLLARLEGELGSELQDRQRFASRAFDRFQRGKNQSASDFVTQFERLYSEAVSHGLAMSRTLLSQKLLDKAQLSEHQELWIMQQCNGDYSRYETIRQALKRIPSLDPRHSHDANMYYGNNDQPSSPDDQPHQHNEYNPFRSAGLQTPAPDPVSYNAPDLPTGTSESDQYSGYPIEEEQDESTDDDFLSVADEDNDAAELAQAWVFHRKKKRQFRKGKPKNRFKRRQKGKNGTWYSDEQVFVAHNLRNLDSNPPPGWTKEMDRQETLRRMRLALALQL